MVKEPRAGRVKTRLGADIGMIDATWWFRHQVARLLRQVGRDPRWTTWLAVAPDTALTSAAWPADLPRLAQGSGNLGTRMRRVLGSFEDRDTLIIGADIPGIDRSAIAEAFAALGRHDMVFGPAPDGGYWLVGKKAGALRRGFLDDVRWSSAHALADSMRSAGPSARIGLVRELADVDRAADLPGRTL